MCINICIVFLAVLIGCGTLSITLTEEIRLSVVEISAGESYLGLRARTLQKDRDK